MPPAAAIPAAIPRKRSLKRRVLWGMLYVVYLAAIGFAGLKFYAYIVYDVPLTRAAEPDDVWRHYYPELWRSGAIETDAAPHDGKLDVLLLGGSVLQDVAGPLEEALRERYGERVRVYNLCKSAHTTRDSYFKFQRLRGQRFDLVVLYHGINDCRMNCVPPETFRDDYTHCAWYRSLERRLKAGVVILDDVNLLADTGAISLGVPDEKLRRFGREIKTAGPFRRNVEFILRTAREKHTPVLLMSFACYLPADYSEAKFRAGELDYGPGHFKIRTEVWGDPPDVVAGIAAHNAVLRSLARQYDNVLFVDQEAKLPHDGTTFCDVCHLTPRGDRQFAANVLPAIVRRFPPEKHDF